MGTCPKCGTSYGDSLLFCLMDASPLLRWVEPPTVVTRMPQACDECRRYYGGSLQCCPREVRRTGQRFLCSVTTQQSDLAEEPTLVWGTSLGAQAAAARRRARRRPSRPPASRPEVPANSSYEDFAGSSEHACLVVPRPAHGPRASRRSSLLAATLGLMLALLLLLVSGTAG